MKERRGTLISLCFALILSSCAKITPAGFWRSFEKSQIETIISDQGPWGGHCAIYWNADKENYFNVKRVIDLAVKNGWELTDSSKFHSNELKSWHSSYFPLSHEGFNPNAKGDFAYKDFPRWINADLTVFTFKSGWVSIQPGSDRSTEANGIVVISANGREMSVYHIWGE